MTNDLRKGRGSLKYPDKQSIIDEIKRRYYDGLPVNYSAIRIEDDSLRRRSTTLFGGYKNAVTEAGFNYDEFRIDTEMSSYYGNKFEELAGDIFDELGIYRRGEHGTIYQPDMVLQNNVWVDVKLSEWTIANRDCLTVENYVPHCRMLIIVYMRGRKGERLYANNVRLINIDEYIKQLPRRKRGYFYEEVNKIKSRLGEIEDVAS